MTHAIKRVFAIKFEIRSSYSLPKLNNIYLSKCLTSSAKRVGEQDPLESVDLYREFSLDPFDRIKDVQKPFIDDLQLPPKRSFNLAAYVNRSLILQQLLRLGVSLYDIENTNYKAANYLLGLNFERDCVEHIKFLLNSGLKDRNLGRFISGFPMVFAVPLDDLQVRINYLESKGFDPGMISKILNRSSIILSTNVKTTDFKLGQLQIEFDLPATAIRKILTSFPLVIAIPVDQFKLVNFCLKEEFGFRHDEIVELLSKQPELIEMLRPVLIKRFDLVHNIIGLSHKMIVMFPKLLTGPRVDIEHRSLYLKKLRRDQYDPKKPLYVPPSALYNKSDQYFCDNYAKTSFDDYKLFIRNR